MRNELQDNSCSLYYIKVTSKQCNCIDLQTVVPFSAQNSQSYSKVVDIHTCLNTNDIHDAKKYQHIIDTKLI